MALWSFDTRVHHDVYTIVYLLKDALQSALDDAWFFERTACPKPDIKGAGHAEIAARLGRFRDACNVFKEREALMVTKIVRARNWAIELRREVADLQQEVSVFLEATEACHRLQGEFMRDAERIFNGGQSPLRFVAQRQGDGPASSPGAGGKPGVYLVGGQISLYELRAACEALLGQINREFFTAPADGEAVPEAERFLALLDSRLDRQPVVH